MKRCQIGLSLGPLLTIEEILSLASFADDLTSVRSLWIPESWGRETFSTLGALARVTKRVLLGASILNIYSRSPATIAMGATTIDCLSTNRMIIGLGSSTEAIVSNWHGQLFDEPLKRMREYTECIRLIIGGGKVCYKGEIVSVRNFGLVNPPTRKSIPIFVAAVNQKMTSVAVGLGDGILLYLRPVDELIKTVKNIKRLANRRPFEVALTMICAVSEKDPEKAKERAATTLGFYIAVGKYYRKFLSEHGFEVQVREIVSAYEKGGTMAVSKAVPQSMVKSLTVSGSIQECLDSLKRFSATGITLPILQVNPVERDESSIREFISSL